jgi:hypothetical protein
MKLSQNRDFVENLTESEAVTALRTLSWPESILQENINQIKLMAPAHISETLATFQRNNEGQNPTLLWYQTA